MVSQYDIDLGPIALSTIYPDTAFQEFTFSEQPGARPPALQNTLINGTNVMLSDPSKGRRFKTTFAKGKKHLLRFVNTSVDSTFAVLTQNETSSRVELAFFQVSIDSHNMTVIQSDFVPVNPFTTSSLSIGIGQRYDVIVEANQPVAAYWLRAEPQGACIWLPSPRSSSASCSQAVSAVRLMQQA